MRVAETIKEKVIAYSQTIGIDLIGFTSMEALLESGGDYLTYQSLGYSSGFEEQTLEKRVDACLSLENAQTVISVAIAYPNDGVLTKGVYHGHFCRASWGRDYHVVLRERLEKLAAYLGSLVEGLDYQIMVDTGSLSDRGAALCCGLGWIGRNSNLITKGFGSFVYLGELIINLALAPDDHRVEDGCGNCTRCADACPLGAIDSQRRMVDAGRCLAYRTLDKSELSQEVCMAIGEQGYIYGCDICQLVCPYNQGGSHDGQDDFVGTYEEISPNLLHLLEMSNKTFRKTYGHLSGSWRGKGVLQRNALLILGWRNLTNLREMYLAILADEGKESLKTAAQWALTRLDENE